MTLTDVTVLVVAATVVGAVCFGIGWNDARNDARLAAAAQLPVGTVNGLELLVSPGGDTGCGELKVTLRRQGLHALEETADLPCPAGGGIAR